MLSLSVLAAANLAVGVWMTLHPAAYPTELQRVSEWAQTWAHGVNPYGSAALGVDYPPWALVTIWPLSVVPAGARTAVWTMANLTVAVALAWALAKLSGEMRTRRTLLMLLLCSTACLRTFGQFSLVAYALAIAGVFASSFVIGGILLGLSLMKPQVGGVILLWILLIGDWRRVVVAVAVPIFLTSALLAAVSVGPAALAAQYVHVITLLYGSPINLPGHSELRPWLWSLIPSARGNFWLMFGVFLLLLLPACVAWARGRIIGWDKRFELLALLGVVSLLVVRHLSYDFLLLLPALVAWRSPPFASVPHAPRWMFYGLATLLVAAVPSWVRLAVRLGAPQAILVITELDRVMCVAVWIALAWRLNVQSSEPAKATGT